MYIYRLPLLLGALRPATYVTGVMAGTNVNVVELISGYIPFNPVIYTRLAAVNRDFYSVFTSEKLWRPYDLYSVKQDIFKDFLARLPGFEDLMVFSWYIGFSEPGANIFTNIRKEMNGVPNLFLHLGQAVNTLYAECARDPYFFNETTYFAYMELSLNRVDPPALRLPEAYFDSCASSLHMHFYSKCPPQSARFGKSCPHELVKARVPEICANDAELVQLFHGLVAHPRVLYWQKKHSKKFAEQIRLILNDLYPNRNAFLSFLEGMPEFLDMAPEYWTDREAGLQVFCGISPMTRAIAHSQFMFIYECPYAEVIVAGMETIPFSGFQAPPECLMESKEIFYRALKALNQDSLEHWLHSDIFIGVEWWQDPDALASLVDRAYFEPHAIEHLPVPRHGADLLNSLCDNYDWMAQRVCIRPTSWLMASDRLKKSRSLLMQALTAMKESREPTPVPVKYYHPRRTFGMKLPSKFHTDQEMIGASVAGSGLKSIPRSLWTEELVRSNMVLNHECRDIFSKPGFKYRFARAAVMADIRQLETCTWALQAFAGDPVISPFLCHHIHEVYFIVACRLDQKELFKSAFDTLIRDEGHLKRTLNTETAARLLLLDPEQYKGSNLPLDLDVALEFIKQLGTRSVHELGL